MQLRIELEQDVDGRGIAAVPTLCSLRTDGADRAEVLAKVQALALHVLAERLAEGEAAPDPLTVSFQAVKEYRLGVLLVHGIGTQPSGETLVRWGDVLLKTIDHATRHRVAVTAGPARRDRQGGFEDRAESVVRLRAGDREERWLLSEGWWADAFLAPSYRELVSWSVRALPWSVALYIAQRYWQAVQREGGLASAGRAAIATAQLLAALALAPVFILFLTLVHRHRQKIQR
jgi:hypothetical protein